MTIGPTGSGKVSLARQMARSVLALDLGDFEPEVIAKAKLGRMYGFNSFDSGIDWKSDSKPWAAFAEKPCASRDSEIFRNAMYCPIDGWRSTMATIEALAGTMLSAFSPRRW